MEPEDFLAVYDVSDSVATVVNAGTAQTWQALMAVDLIEVGRRKPLVGVLGALRAIPDLVARVWRHEPLPARPDRLRLEDTASIPADLGGWVLLAKQEREGIALGLVGKFWRPVIAYRSVTPETFVTFDEPGYAKTVYVLTVRPLTETSTLLEATMRTATTDERARRWFRRYWIFGVASGARILVAGVLDVVRDTAEHAGRASKE
jgi:hypothetical protein